MMLTPQNTWLVCPQPRPNAALRLFCFPYAGGGASAFRGWSLHVPPEIEVCALQLPGRETRLREPLFTSLPSLIHTLTDVLTPSFDRPFAFFGHSMGALICFELTRELRRLRRPVPKMLFVSARNAPQMVDPDPPVHQLPEPEFIEELRTFNGTSEAILQDPDLLRMVIPILRADFAINETYAYTDEAPLDLPITVFGGVDDHAVDEDGLRAWEQQTSSTFRLRMFPGNHFFLNSVQPMLIQSIVQQLHLI